MVGKGRGIYGSIRRRERAADVAASGAWKQPGPLCPQAADNQQKNGDLRLDDETIQA